MATSREIKFFDKERKIKQGCEILGRGIVMKSYQFDSSKVNRTALDEQGMWGMMIPTSPLLEKDGKPAMAINPNDKAPFLQWLKKEGYSLDMPLRKKEWLFKIWELNYKNTSK